MKSTYILVVGILCIVTPLPAASASIVSSITGNVVKSIAISSNALDLFKELDKHVPSDKFKDFIKKLDQHRNSYSAGAGKLADELKAQLSDALETYQKSTQAAYEWCGDAEELLQSYLRLLQNFSKSKARLQQRIVIRVLEEDTKKFSTAQNNLEQSSRSFNKASGSIVALIAQLKADSEKNDDKEKLNEIKKFHEDIKDAIVKADEKVSETKIKLKNEVSGAGEVKTQALDLSNVVKNLEFEEIGDLDDKLRKEVKVPIEKLIEECRNYRKQHIAKQDSIIVSD